MIPSVRQFSICVFWGIFLFLKVGYCSGYNGTLCDFPFEHNCNTCNWKGCTSCQAGYYGRFTCHERCNCTHGYCFMDGECIENGTYGCTSKCKKCDQLTKTCIECEAGYFGKICEHKCINCQPNTTCDKVTGRCDRCKKGSYVEECDISCYSKCATCQRNQHKPCSTCPNGWRGASCDIRCPRHCFNYSCDISSGVCYSGCSLGMFYGSRCLKRCPYSCLNSKCNQTGMCVNGCQPRFCGLNCSYLCPFNETNCLKFVKNQVNQGLVCETCKKGYFLKHNVCSKIDEPSANKSSSYTLFNNGSVQNTSQIFYNNAASCGKNCKMVSSSGLICDRVFGLCMHGCIDGYYGGQCDVTCDISCLSKICDQENGSCELRITSTSKYVYVHVHFKVHAGYLH